MTASHPSLQRSLRELPANKLDEMLEEAGEEALKLAYGSADLEKLSKAAETARALAEAREGNFGLRRFLRWTKWFASIATSFTIIVALVSLFVQHRENIDSQNRQMASDESTQWREAMRGVSFGDPSKALAEAIWMESFFDSRTDQYRRLSRRVAATLLPDVENVTGFDSVLTDLVKHTNKDNQLDVIDVGQKVSRKQWDQYGTRPVDPTNLPFVQKEAPPAAYHTGGWELDTVSHGLWRIWIGNNVASPRDQYLENIILENNRLGETFAADFTGANFTNGVFYRVSFGNADFTRATLTNVIILADVDFSEMKKFDGSNWTNANWWRARKMSVGLCKYLQINDPAPKGTNLRKGCKL